MCENLPPILSQSDPASNSAICREEDPTITGSGRPPWRWWCAYYCYFLAGGFSSTTRYSPRSWNAGLIEASPTLNSSIWCGTPISVSAWSSNFNSGTLFGATADTNEIETPYFELMRFLIRSVSQRAVFNATSKSSAKSDASVSTNRDTTPMGAGWEARKRAKRSFCSPESLRGSASLRSFNRSAWRTKFSFVRRAASPVAVEASRFASAIFKSLSSRSRLSCASLARIRSFCASDICPARMNANRWQITMPAAASAVTSRKINTALFQKSAFDDKSATRRASLSTSDNLDTPTVVALLILEPLYSGVALSFISRGPIESVTQKSIYYRIFCITTNIWQTRFRSISG